MSAIELVQDYGIDQRDQPIFEQLLRERAAIWLRIRHEQRLNVLTRQLLATASLAFAGYGAIMGAFDGPLQALASAIKLPLLYLLTLAICLPTFYLFNLLYGGRLTARQVLALALSAIAVTATLTLAFAPITIFFLITARDYNFYMLLNVAILGLTGFAGLRFLVSGIRALDTPDPADLPVTVEPEEPSTASAPKPPKPVRMPLLQIWLLVYGFVGTQLGWTLRPFFGAPDLPFQIFRPLEGNFYSTVAQALMQALGLR